MSIIELNYHKTYLNNKKYLECVNEVVNRYSNYQFAETHCCSVFFSPDACLAPESVTVNAEAAILEYINKIQQREPVQSIVSLTGSDRDLADFVNIAEESQGIIEDAKSTLNKCASMNEQLQSNLTTCYELVNRATSALVPITEQEVD